MKNKFNLESFMFPLKNPYPLGGLRLGLSAVLLFQAWLIAEDIIFFWGQSGLLQKSLNQYIIGDRVPVFVNLTKVASAFAIKYNHFLIGLFVIYIASLFSLLLGFKTKVSASIALVAHLLLKFNEGQTSGYGVDTFAQMFLFYCVIFPVGDTLSIDSRGQDVKNKSVYGFSLRLMQIHLCIAYFSSGVAKCLGAQWRSGEVIWRALNLPQFSVFDMTWMAHFPWIAFLIAWGTLFLEIGYPLLLGWRKTRLFGALAIIGMHMGIAVFMGLWTFSLVMIVLTSSLFLVNSSHSRREVIEDDEQNVVVFFDGDCNICNRFVRFILNRQNRGRFRFAPLSSNVAKKRLDDLGKLSLSTHPESIVVIIGETVYTHFDAIINIFKNLGAFWSFATLFYCIPRFMRVWVYKLVARNRTRFFATKNHCRLLDGNFEKYFLS